MDLLNARQRGAIVRPPSFVRGGALIGVWKTIVRCAALALACTVAALGAETAAAGGFYTVKDLGPTAGTAGYAFDVNESGTVVGQYVVPDTYQYRGFLIDDDGFVDVGTLGPNFTSAWAVNDEGVAVGTSDTKAFVFDREHGIQRVPGLEGVQADATDIDEGGRIVGHARFGGGFLYTAFMVEGGAVRRLPIPAADSRAYGMNNAGQVVGEYRTSPFGGNVRAYLYDSLGFRDLGTLGGRFTHATAINDKGTIVGHGEIAPLRGFRSFVYDTLLGMRMLPSPFGDSYMYAMDVNNDGVIVGEAYGSVGNRAWLHENGVTIDLNSVIDPLSGWTLMRAQAINDAGQIVGQGELNGEWRAFLLTPANPVIFLPGITGSVLERGGTELWPKAGSLFWPSDRWLLDLRLDPNGDDEWEGAGPVQAADILRTFDPYGPVNKDIYKPTLDRLAEQGYVEGRNLFLFPFDWRRSADVNADRLIEFMKSTRACPTCRFDVLAHSQGGLVTLAALRKASSMGLVRRVVTMGTPVLGSTKGLGVVEYHSPCLIEPGGACLLDPENTRRAVRNMPGVYELLPSPLFHAAEGSPLKLLLRGFLDYDAWTNIVKAHRNGDLVERARAFHASGIDDFHAVDPAVSLYRVVGDGQQTYDYIEQQRRKVTYCGGRAGCITRTYTVYELRYSDGGGDGTVLLNSADLRRCIGSLTTFDRRNGIPNKYFRKGHLELAQDADVLAFVAKFFKSGEKPELLDCGVTSRMLRRTSADVGRDQPVPPTGVQVEVVGPATGAVTDAVGRTLGTKAGAANGQGPAVVKEIPGGGYEWMAPSEEDESLGTQVFALNDPGAFTGSLTVDDETVPVRLRVLEFDAGAEAGSAVFDLRGLPAGAKLTLPFTDDPDFAGLRLAVDRDGDGTVDEQLAPTAVGDGTAPADEEPPATDLEGWSDGGGSATVVMTASDGGAGVAETRYSVDGGPWRRYMVPFEAPLDAQLVFSSIDKAGNSEDDRLVTVRDVVPDDAPNRRFAARPLADGERLRRLINAAGDEDWFRFEADGSSEYRLHLHGLTEDYDLEVYGATGALVTASAERGKQSETVEVRPAAGGYFVRVLGAAGAYDEKHEYHLDFTARS